ncbi:serine protease FAM111A [Rhineura floridana]|uniref:serine protease FAM111A n=1 Tax=Rhineura floridana TaxID=261503 RepID=UPI002AC8271E|nr:serine protease FAM111A [Rhineura floridana]
MRPQPHCHPLPVLGSWWLFSTGETIKAALCKDGRFIPELEEKDWKLMEGNKAIPNTHSVNRLSNRTFYVEVEKHAKSGGGPNKELVPQASQKLRTFHYFKPHLLDCYPSLKKQKDIIDDFFANAKKQHKQPNDILKVYKTHYSKEIKNATPIKMVKIQANLSRSVGYIEWGITGKEGSATCFVLCNRYILTCHHVVGMIVGDGIEEKEWAVKMSKSARVTFSYEDNHPKEEDWFSLEEWLEISDKDLDFAVLQLKENENESKLPEGLVPFTYPPPFVGILYIIGHPDGETKSLDSCSVVTVCQRQQECDCRYQQGQEAECNNFNCGYHAEGSRCIHMLSPRVYSEVINKLDVVTYDTSFFWGSSGSPVFDKNGNLVAVHAAGYHYRGKSKQRSIIEFGYSMKSILSVIEKKHKCWYDSQIVSGIQTGPDTGEAASGEPMEID